MPRPREGVFSFVPPARATNDHTRDRSGGFAAEEAAALPLLSAERDIADVAGAVK
jgi:hypothetical protein